MRLLERLEHGVYEGVLRSNLQPLLNIVQE